MMWVALHHGLKNGLVASSNGNLSHIGIPYSEDLAQSAEKRGGERNWGDFFCEDGMRIYGILICIDPNYLSIEHSFRSIPNRILHIINRILLDPTE